MTGTAPVVFLVTWMRSLLLINMVNLLQSIRSVTRGWLTAMMRSQWSVRLDLSSRGLPDRDDPFFLGFDSG